MLYNKCTYQLKNFLLQNEILDWWMNTCYHDFIAGFYLSVPHSSKLIHHVEVVECDMLVDFTVYYEYFHDHYVGYAHYHYVYDVDYASDYDCCASNDAYYEVNLHFHLALLIFRFVSKKIFFLILCYPTPIGILF